MNTKAQLDGYTVELRNMGRTLEGDFPTLSAAILAARATGFECSFWIRGNFLGTWSPIGGENFTPAAASLAQERDELRAALEATAQELYQYSASADSLAAARKALRLEMTCPTCHGDGDTYGPTRQLCSLCFGTGTITTGGGR